MHVDGFRFDLASVLTRDEDGSARCRNPPVIWDIETDPALAGTKLIAEAWDAAGLYQVGSFVGDAWKEWNGKFRDDVRSFVKSDNGYVARAWPAAASGSPDVYGTGACASRSRASISSPCTTASRSTTSCRYNEKHNEANGEDNRDGANDNLQLELRRRGADRRSGRRRAAQSPGQELLHPAADSRLGAPMILMGDEVRRTQQGNNNAYCQDNEISWFDWALVERARRHLSLRQAIDRQPALLRARPQRLGYAAGAAEKGAGRVRRGETWASGFRKLRRTRSPCRVLRSTAANGSI